MKIKLAVLFGGNSSEYSVSLHSVGSFLNQINKEKYEIYTIGVSQKGEFYNFIGSIDDIEHDKWLNNKDAHKIAWISNGFIDLNLNKEIYIDCAFAVMHGKNCEDGTIQGLFQALNIKYVGCDILSSAISMDKEIMHIICKDSNIKCANYVCLKEFESYNFNDIVEKISLPWIIKPCNAGSSYGVHYIENEDDFNKNIKDCFYHDGKGKILVEEMVDGFEIGCAVMGNLDNVFTSIIDEIEITNKFFDFEGKYETTSQSKIHCPARVDEETVKKAQDIAKKVYIAMNCKGLARVDMFVCKNGDIILNELNTIPGFTQTSRYPSMMKQSGIEFKDLIDKLIDLALN